MGFVLGDHPHLADARIDAVREWKIDDPELAAKRHRGLGAPLGEIVKAGTAPTCKYQRESLTSKTTDETLGRLHSSCFPEETRSL